VRDSGEEVRSISVGEEEDEGLESNFEQLVVVLVVWKLWATAVNLASMGDSKWEIGWMFSLDVVVVGLVPESGSLRYLGVLR